MRLFNILVMDQMVRGTAETVSALEFADTLGKADSIVYEIEVEDASGTTPTISVRHLHCNSGKAFVGLPNIVTTASIATGSLPYRDVKTVSAPLAGLGQVGVTLGGTSPVARVRIWACGRSA